MKVLFFATIRLLTKEKETDIPAPATAIELLLALSEKYGPPFRAKAIEEGVVSSELIMLINGRNVVHMGGSDAPLKEADTVAIFPVIGGG